MQDNYTKKYSVTPTEPSDRRANLSMRPRETIQVMQHNAPSETSMITTMVEAKETNVSAKHNDRASVNAINKEAIGQEQNVLKITRQLG